MRVKLDFTLVQMSFTRAAIAAPSAPVAKVVPAGVMCTVDADAAGGFSADGTLKQIVAGHLLPLLRAPLCGGGS